MSKVVWVASNSKLKAGKIVEDEGAKSSFDLGLVIMVAEAGALDLLLGIKTASANGRLSFFMQLHPTNYNKSFSKNIPSNAMQN